MTLGIKRLYFAFLIVSCINVKAQGISDFNAFRDQMLNNYQSYKESILENYETFIKTTWNEYQLMKGHGVKMHKPITVPDVSVMPIASNSNNILVDPLSVDTSTISKIIPCKNIQLVPSLGNKENCQIDFYGQSILLPKKIIRMKDFSFNNKQIAFYWRKLIDDGWEEIAGILYDYKQKYNYNDYMLFLLTQNYVREIVEDENQRNLLSHYLMVACGYDVRIGRIDDSLVLLLPFKEQLYSRLFIIQGDRYFYLFANQEMSSLNKLWTYEVPYKNNDLQCLNVQLIGSPKLPYNGCSFHITDGQLSISGKVNLNLIKLLDVLPQMDNKFYVTPVLDERCRKEIIESLRCQLKDKSLNDKLSMLLHFVQYAFRYATDNNQFGKEKPFFFEELLYYPQCDCEDRSVFFIYLVQELLNLDCHLLIYPSHIAVSIAIEGASGNYYVFDNKKFYIADPTYLGASIGDCMPNYAHVTPRVITLKQ